MRAPLAAGACRPPALSPATAVLLQRSAGNAAAAELLRREGARVTRAGGQVRRLQRTTVNTNGGVFDNGPGYVPRSGSVGAKGESVGAGLRLDFIPGDNAEAPAGGIVLIQTVKSVTDKKPDDSLDTSRSQGNTAVSTNPDDVSLVSPSGAAVDIDVHRGRDEPNTSPIYGVGYGAPAPVADLKGGTPTLGRTQRGSHAKDPSTGAFLAPVNAQMEDWPRRFLQVAGQTFEMTFEVAALVTDGPMKDTYLGSIEWGWTSDATAQVTMKPFQAVASGAPTARFMGAASTWNSAVFHDQSFWGWLTDTTADTVDLPITTLPSGAKAAVDMTTREILARIPVVEGEVAKLPAGPGVDRTNKEFELAALGKELKKRKIVVDVNCSSISDTGGAASPPEDEVWLSLRGGGGTNAVLTLTGTRTFRAGDSHTYEFPVADFLPLKGPVEIEVMETDRAGPGGRASDDTLMDISWGPPFTQLIQLDADFHDAVGVRFDK